MKISRKQLSTSIISTTLAEVKEHLRITHAEQDNYITRLVLVAEDTITNLTDIQLRLTRYIVYFNNSILKLPFKPVRIINSVKYRNTNEKYVDLDQQYYQVLDNNKIYIPSIPSGLSTLYIDDVYDFRISYNAGFNSISNEELKLVINFLVEHWYRNETPVSQIKYSHVPFTLKGKIENLKAIPIFEDDIS